MTLDSLYEILQWDHSNESYGVVLSGGIVCDAITEWFYCLCLKN